MGGENLKNWLEPYVVLEFSGFRVCPGKLQKSEKLKIWESPR